MTRWEKEAKMAILEDEQFLGQTEKEVKDFLDNHGIEIDEYYEDDWMCIGYYYADEHYEISFIDGKCIESNWYYED